MLFDSWYSSLQNLKQLRSWDWPFFVGLKSNRQVNPDGTGNRAIRELEWPEPRQRVHLKGFGWVQAYRVPNGQGASEASYFVSPLEQPLDDEQLKRRRKQAQQIEGYHRGLKRECHIERCQARKARKPRNHIMLALRAFVRLEWCRYVHGVSRQAIKQGTIREAVSNYLQDPIYTLDASLRRAS